MTTIDHRRLPRKKRSPTPRDQDIFIAYRTQGRTQQELAKDNRLTQRRIGQIIHRVEHWLANLAPPAAVGCVKRSGTHHDPLTTEEHRRLEYRLCRHRSQTLYDRALRAFDRAKDELKTVREGHRDQKPFQETTTREVNRGAHFLRVAQRANSDLAKLAASEPPPEPKPQVDEWQLDRLMFDRLNRARAEAEAEGKVAKATGNLDVVEHWFAALVGDHDYFEINPASLAPAAPLGQLAQFFHHPSVTTSDATLARSASEGGEAPAQPNSSVPASTLEPHYPEAPPSSFARDSETINFERRTLNSTSHSASNLSNPSSASATYSSPQPPTPPHLPAPSETSNPKSQIPPPSKIPNPKSKIENLLARRLAHDRKLQQLAEFRRRGLPCLFEFDPADGPLPNIYSPTDYAITEPGSY